MLTNDDASEQNAAGKVIWTLGFDDSAKQKIVEEPGCIEALEKLIEESDDTSVKQQATGALWVAGVKQCPHTDGMWNSKRREHCGSLGWNNVLILTVCETASDGGIVGRWGETMSSYWRYVMKKLLESLLNNVGDNVSPCFAPFTNYYFCLIHMMNNSCISFRNFYHNLFLSYLFAKL